MSTGYFHTVQAKTPTRFWVNNPTAEEARMAIAAGAEYCTTNPTYAAKMAVHPEMKDQVQALIVEVLNSISGLSEAASEIQSRLVGRLMDIFADVHKASGATRGWVSIQSDPENEDKSSHILATAERNRRLGPNYIAKVPVTRSGLDAIAELSRDGVPVIATEVMSISQAISAAETYVKAIAGQQEPAPIYITHITGIFDQHLGEWNKSEDAGLGSDALRHAGALVAKKLYNLFAERNYPVTILGGGARGLHHFTDFVGSRMHITINWKGTADRLIELNPELGTGFDTSVDPVLLAELMEKAPVFRQAWEESGLTIDEYQDYPPVELFRSMFLKGWKDLKQLIREVRDAE